MLPREIGMQDPAPLLPEGESLPRPVLARIQEAELHAVPTQPPAALSSGPDAMSLLKAFRRRWLLALLLALLAAGGVGAAAWFLIPPNYQVFAQIHVNSTQDSYLGNKNAEGRGDFSVYMKTQMGRLRSRHVFAKALNRDEVKRLAIVRQQADIFSFLEEEVKVESPDNSELLTVYMNGPDPAELTPLINGIANAYLDDVVNDDFVRRGKRVAELEKIATDFKDQLRKKRDAWLDKAKQVNGSDPLALAEKQKMLFTAFGEARKLHTQVKFDLSRARNSLEALKVQEKLIDQIVIPESAVTEALDADPIARQHLATIAKWGEVISLYERVSPVPKEERPYRDALNEQKQLQKKIDARKEELRGPLLEKHRGRARAEFDVAVLRLQNEIGPLEKQEEQLLAEVQRLAQEADKVGNTSTDLEMLRDGIRSDEITMAKMAEELEKLKVELHTPSRVKMFQEVAAQRKDRKRMLMILIGVPLVTFLGVCFLVSWLEFRSRRIHTPDEVLTGLGLRLVGSVPAMPRNAQIPLMSGSEEEQSDFEHSLVESIDGIRTLLLRDASVGAARVLMVTSAVSGEGKTTLATQLAGSLARAGRRTLLLDCDLRRPSIHQMFELPQQPGLSEVLLGEVHLAEATLATPIDSLWVVPAGQWDRNVMQALARDGSRGIFEKLRSEYDFVIVDSHPVLPATDSLLIGQNVDAVIFSLMRDVSQMPKVYSASQRLQSLGIRVLGAVVNGTEEESYGDSYQYNPAPQQA